MMISCSPEATASSTTYWMVGLSTSGSISLGWALVAGRNRVPRPAAGKTPLRTRMDGLLDQTPTADRRSRSDAALIRRRSSLNLIIPCTVGASSAAPSRVPNDSAPGGGRRWDSTAPPARHALEHRDDRQHAAGLDEHERRLVLGRVLEQ